ncbi:MAG: hypothetical protein ISR58_08465 [Anaerolineales bacterium]|nr:hypothetical protein [Chloroflexota bacterium]MBL6981210.1 hypothetical protein [Anaerolineales bacterium]
MKNRSPLLRIVILVFIFALIFPTGIVLAQDDEDDHANSDRPHEIVFEVINESQFDFTLWLYGPTEYDINVPPDSEGTFIIKNGWYAFTMNSCNLYEVGTFDFTTHKAMHVPICGATAGHIGQANNHYDSSDYIRPATIQVRNRTLEHLEVYIRTLDEDHFLKFEPLEIKWVTIEDARDEFVYSYVACDELLSGYTRLYISVPFDLTCDK